MGICLSKKQEQATQKEHEEQELQDRQKKEQGRLGRERKSEEEKLRMNDIGKISQNSKRQRGWHLMQMPSIAK